MTASGPPFEIGRELADAMAAEEQHRSRIAGPSPLGGVEYRDAAVHSSLFVESEADQLLDRIIDGFGALETNGRNRFRDLLTMEDLYTILRYTNRSVVRLLRSADPSHARRLFVAAAMVDVSRIDYRDLLWSLDRSAAGLGRLGMDPAPSMLAAADLAGEAVADLIRQRAGPDRPTTFHSAGLHEISTQAGPDLIRFDFNSFEPTLDIVTAGLALLDEFTAQGYRAAMSAGVAPAATWFVDENGSRPDKPISEGLLGCVSVSGLLAVEGQERASQSLLAYVAQCADDSAAARLSALASAHDETRHVSVTRRRGPLLCVLIGRSIIVGVPNAETTDSLQRFVSVVERALRAASD